MTTRSAGYESSTAHAASRGLVLMLHGGAERSRWPDHRARLAYLRMLPFLRALPPDVLVWRLRYRYYGWNGADADPVRDLEWALGRAAEVRPELPVILVGHSMGARAALWGGGDPRVAAVCALAPWIEAGDPYQQLAGKQVLIAHGDRDRITDPSASRRYALAAEEAGARVTYLDVSGDGHAMLRRASHWNCLVGAFVSTVLDADAVGGSTLARDCP
ncbi:alpha/beta fold hydrolase [Catellatospora sp. KI3]|uniref:alpha/beta hydrolase n=1 Tax=Catellatospora sp. KI3 TaxID=3041620 RepID=UPI002482DDEF|nr:alpha/beta fold hydrolase [Catellatospora sp. KI3]MDI1465687.1 alpha/beta fold hydrolase [Catellatospora sp. KI3]